MEAAAGSGGASAEPPPPTVGVASGENAGQPDALPPKRLRPEAAFSPADANEEAGGASTSPAGASWQTAAGAAVAAAPAPEWAAVIERVKSAIVAIRVTGVRPFEDSPAGVWQGTGFVVSLDRPEQALILTNRHIISTGPIRALATFDEHEELPAWPVYRDAVHDFGLLQFDATGLRFTPHCQIPLNPCGLRVGAEVLVIGNDNAEKIQILPATIARVDRNCPEYDDTNYQDENTFYAGAGSNTSGGSSGSPVIDRAGACIALNAGGASEAASAYYLPLDRVVYVLEWLKSHRDQAPLPPRGTLLTKFLFQPFDMLRRLGFTEDQERGVLKQAEAAAGAVGPVQQEGRPKGMLVVESSLPGTESEEKLRPGDVVLKIASQACFNFVSLEAVLDSSVGSAVALQVARAGEVADVTVEAVDLHKLIPFDFVECAGGVFHQLSYHTCKRFHIPLQDRGVFVVQSGFGFGLEVPYHAVVSSVAGRRVHTLSDFEAALSGVPDGEAFEVSWYNPTTNERRSKHSSVRMERTLWPLCMWNFAPGWPNTWKREALTAPVAPTSQAPPTPAAGGAGKAMAAVGETEVSAAEEAICGSDTDATAGAEEPGPEDLLGYPRSRDATIARVQPMLCTVTSRVAHEYATDFIQSEDERNSTLIRRFGVGLVVDAARGLVLTDRYTCPQPLAHVELTFAQIVTTDATCSFVHPQHNLVLLKYDPASVQELPVRALDLRSGTPDTQGAAESTNEANHDGEPAVEDLQELSIGEILSFVSLHGDHRLSAKQVTVGSVYLKAWAFAEPPAYRERNLEICNLNDTLQGLGGLLVEPGLKGRTRAWFAQFPAGKKRYVAGVPVPVLAGLLRPLGLFGGSLPPSVSPTLPKARVPALGCELEELSLAKARRYHGMSLESTRELAASCCDGRRQVLMVSRVTAGGECDGLLAEGDVLLRVAGQPVTRPQEVERLMEERPPGGEESAVVWTVLRSRTQREVLLKPTWRSSDGTRRLLVFNGIVLRPTPRAVAERGGPVPPHTKPGEGLYFWHLFPGSPADTFGLAAPGWLVQVDGEPIPSIDSLLEALHSGKFRGKEWLRCRTMDSEGRPTVRALQPDPRFWPTVELVHCQEDTGSGGPAPRWARVEHHDS